MSCSITLKYLKKKKNDLVIFEKNFTILHTIPDWIDLKKIKKFTLDSVIIMVFFFF